MDSLFNKILKDITFVCPDGDKCNLTREKYYDPKSNKYINEFKCQMCG